MWDRKGERGPPEEAPGSEQADGLDRLGCECEPVGGLAVGVQERQARRDCERVARQQPREHDHRGGQPERARGPHGQRDREPGESEGRCDEADPGARTLGEVLWGEGAVDACADRARDDDEVASHVTITVPLMSCEWSVQTYS